MMRFPLMSAAVVCAAYFHCVAGAVEAQAAGRQAPPQLPIQPIYDGQPGPFIVRLSGQSDLDNSQRAVIANAVRNWSGPAFKSFVICFRSGGDRGKSGAAGQALNAVARELKTQGAQVVVIPSGGNCSPLSPSPASKGAYVEIVGVVRL